MLNSPVELKNENHLVENNRIRVFFGSNLSHFRTGVAGLSITLWMIAFLIGNTLSSATYMSKLGQASGIRAFGAATVMLMLTWTWTNVVLLSIFAGVTGEILRWGEKHRKEPAMRKDPPNYRSSAIRSFLITLLLLSGNLVLWGGAGPLESNLPSQAGQAYYIRIAATVSLLSFLVNYNPRLIASLIRRIEEFAEEHNKGKEK